jgi:hypothetical protein
VHEVAGGTINCPCHGSKFAVADGTPKAGPAKKPLPAKAVTVQGSSDRPRVYDDRRSAPDRSATRTWQSRFGNPYGLARRNVWTRAGSSIVDIRATGN